MAYFLVTFTPVTGQAFLEGDRTVTGFKERSLWEEVGPGAVFVCYLTRLSRWFGVLEVESGPCRGRSPIFGGGLPLFTPSPDSSVSAHEQYTVRFKVKPDVVLDDLEYAVSIHEPEVWNRLSFTRDQRREDARWKGFLRGNLKRLDDGDGSFLTKLLKERQKKERQKKQERESVARAY